MLEITEKAAVKPNREPNRKMLPFQEVLAQVKSTQTNLQRLRKISIKPFKSTCSDTGMSGRQRCFKEK